MTLHEIATRLHLARDGDRVRVGEVGVGGADGEQDAVGPPRIVEDHLPDLRAYVVRLVAHGVLSDACSRRREGGGSRALQRLQLRVAEAATGCGGGCSHTSGR